MNRYLFFIIIFSLYSLFNEKTYTYPAPTTRRRYNSPSDQPQVMNITRTVPEFPSWTKRIYKTKDDQDELERFKALIREDEESVDTITRNNIPLLYESLHQRAYSLTHVLLDGRPNVYFKDKFGRNALHIAVEGSNPNYDVIEHLLRVTRYIDIFSAENNGRTPMELLILNNDRSDIAQLLVSHGSLITDKAYALAQKHNRTKTLEYFDSISLGGSEISSGDEMYDNDEEFSYDDQTDYLRQHFPYSSDESAMNSDED